MRSQSLEACGLVVQERREGGVALSRALGGGGEEAIADRSEERDGFHWAPFLDFAGFWAGLGFWDG